MKEKNKKMTDSMPDFYSDELIEHLASEFDPSDFDKPLKLTPCVPKMIGAPSDYNEEMDKWEKMMAEKRGETI